LFLTIELLNLSTFASINFDIFLAFKMMIEIIFISVTEVTLYLGRYFVLQDVRIAIGPTTQMLFTSP